MSLCNQIKSNPTQYYYRETQFIDILIQCIRGTMTSKAVYSYDNVTFEWFYIILDQIWTIEKRQDEQQNQLQKKTEGYQGN